MQSPYLKFLNRLLAFSVVYALVSWFVITNIKEEWQSPAWPYIIVFFFSITLLLHRILLKSTGQRFARFANQFMLVTFGKLIFLLAVMLIYVFLVNPADAIPFVVTFFVSYLVYTAFELMEMLKMRSPGKGDETKPEEE